MDDGLGDNDGSFANHPNGARTLVLMGRTGNGKSATGNSILGTEAFESEASPTVVTSTATMESKRLEGGLTVNVIDTPGLFDDTTETEVTSRKIVECIDLAKDGLHAILVVFSIRSRFSEEETATVRTLQCLFGSRLADYMIVVFTGGDKLEDSSKTLEDYYSGGYPKPLEKILEACKGRKVVFDNKTKDEKKREAQLQELLMLVDKTLNENGGEPYTKAVFDEMMEEKKILPQEVEVQGPNELKNIVEARVIGVMKEQENLEKQLAKEQEDRKKQMTEIDELNKYLREAQQENEQLRKLPSHPRRAGRHCKLPFVEGCSIL